MRSVAIGVDIGGTKIHFAIVDDQGNIVNQEIIPTEAKHGADSVLRNLLFGIERMYEITKTLGDYSLKGIGIGSSGQIEFSTGTVAYAGDTLPGWTGVSIKREVEARFPLPVIVDNDVNVIAIAEKHFGAARDLSSFVCLALGTGVGGAIMENGMLIRGAFGGAGELGHVSVSFDGPRCSCGNYGCLEMYASGTGIGRLSAEMTSSFPKTVAWEPNSREVIKAWLAGDPQAIQIMNIVIKALSTGISGFIHMFNPQAVIIGGGVSEAGLPFFTEIRKETARRTVPAMWNVVDLIPSSVGVNSGIIGAAAQLWYYEEQQLKGH
jgi:glucokinase